MTNCDRKGCKNQGIYRPVLIMPAPAYTGSNAKIEIQIGLNICKEHTENTNIDDYLSDKGWEQITSALRGMHRAIPNRESVYVIFNKIEAATPTSSGQDELREQARLVKQMMALPVRENSSALVTVDLWEIADFIAHHTQEAVEAELQELANHYYHHEPDLDNAREALAIGLFNRLAELAAPAIHKRDMEGSGKDE